MRSLRPVPVVLALALAGALATSAHAQSAPAPGMAADATVLNISAEAEARRAPDVATLSAGVVSQAADGDAAMRDNAQRMAKVMQAIAAAGITGKDVQTSGIVLQPQYTYQDGKPPRIDGYQASNTVSVKVRELKKLGNVIQALAAQGANQINGPSFGIDQPEPVYDEARVAALKTAQARAQTYADNLGLKVRRIISISEGRSGGARPMPMMRMTAMAASADAPPVAPGETTLSVNLDVSFELGR